MLACFCERWVCLYMRWSDGIKPRHHLGGILNANIRELKCININIIMTGYSQIVYFAWRIIWHTHNIFQVYIYTTLYCCVREYLQHGGSDYSRHNDVTETACIAELCAGELVVGGGVMWSYDRRQRRAAHFSSAAAAWLYGRRRRRQRRQTEWENTETAHSLDRRFFSGFTGVSHFTCDIRCAADAANLTVNMHAVHSFTVVMS